MDSSIERARHASKQNAQAALTKKRIADIASCPYCDYSGVIRVQSTKSAGQNTVRICTHDPALESVVLGVPNSGDTVGIQPDAQNWPIRDGNVENEKKPAKDSASP